MATISIQTPTRDDLIGAFNAAEDVLQRLCDTLARDDIRLSAALDAGFDSPFVDQTMSAELRALIMRLIDRMNDAARGLCDGDD